ncbi:MAG: 50S ribosomal protein L22 [Candidatus Liptonbacteria bacterium]|nr:50S ribosomal protein L22 [Candidatus Liptonbacteria bacterium]
MARISAQLNHLHMTPRKVRAVADLLRGRTVNEAEAELLLHRRRAAKPLLKLLRSAVANARQQKLESGNLVVSEIRVDQGTMLKRFLPRARGMATPIQKKMCHVIVVLQEGAVKTPRFSIVVERKTKAPPHSHRPKKEKGGGAPQSGDAAPKAPAKQQGFWKRMFRRKSV